MITSVRMRPKIDKLCRDARCAKQHSKSKCPKGQLDLRTDCHEGANSL